MNIQGDTLKNTALKLNEMPGGTAHNSREENEFVKLWIDEGILHIAYKPDIVINILVAKEIYDLRMHFQNGKTYPVICYVNGVLDFEWQAIHHIAAYGLRHISAICYVGVHVVPMGLFLYYTRNYNLQTPSSLAANSQEAMEFLTPYIPDINN